MKVKNKSNEKNIPVSNMSEHHYSIRYPAEIFNGDIMRVADPLGEGQRSKSQEHEGRLSLSEKSQKIAEIEENKS